MSIGPLWVQALTNPLLQEDPTYLSHVKIVQKELDLCSFSQMDIQDGEGVRGDAQMANIYASINYYWKEDW